MKTFGYILLGYGLLLLLAGSRATQVVHQNALGFLLRHLQFGEVLQAFLVMLR
ncbi:MAG TPA: hypothetical protein G4O04_03740 [Anaerolineae bacterium]|nr:hypothetical protein [Anaerolineae bacterium]